MNAHKPAYPTLDKLITVGIDQGLELKDSGLTKREMFAMTAMQGIIANNGGGPDDVASRAVAMADALLSELNESRIRRADELLKALES
jgi:hypothetical protein